MNDKEMTVRGCSAGWIQIASRVIAVFVCSFAVAVIAVAFERAEQKAIEQFSSREDVVAYMQSIHLESYWACYFLSLAAGLAYVALVEIVAFVVRFVMAQVRRPGRSRSK